MASPDNRTKRIEGKVLELWELPEDYKFKAARTVAANAKDVDDCATLLSMIGLTPEDGGADIGRALERGF